MSSSFSGEQKHKYQENRIYGIVKKAAQEFSMKKTIENVARLSGINPDMLEMSPVAMELFEEVVTKPVHDVVHSWQWVKDLDYRAEKFYLNYENNSEDSQNIGSTGMGGTRNTYKKPTTTYTKRKKFTPYTRPPMRRKYPISRIPAMSLAETKHSDHGVSTQVYPSHTIIDLGLSHIVQGTDSTQRIGRKIYLTRITGNCILNATVANVPIYGDTIVCQLWLDKECKGQNPAALAMWATDDVLGLRNADQLSRFKLLHERRMHIEPMNIVAGVPTGVNMNNQFEFTSKLGFPVTFMANSGNVGDILDNNVIMTIVNTNGVPLLPTAVLHTNVRFWYKDN